ncbi:MAG: NAD(P)/FAD-dependent oxidoreductase [Vicinamibacterales bacterium]
MSRSPLFESLRRAFRVAAVASRHQAGGPPIEELIERAASRRRFLRDSAALTAATLVAGCRQREAPAAANPSPGAAPRSGGPRVAIVGGGMAGLNTAYKLQKAGITATVYEGAQRTGGRIFTATNLLGDGLTAELGGEFIDSSHEEMLALMTEFGLERIDTQSPAAAALIDETYFINGRHYTLAQAARAFVPLAKRIFKDYDPLPDVVNYENPTVGAALDRLSIAEYLDRIGAAGWMRELIECAYVTEYGLELNEQSALNFVFLIGTGDLEDPKAFSLLGESDERYKVQGGNQRVVDELAKRLEPQIKRLHRLESIRSKGAGYTLTFQTGATVAEAEADFVVLAIPFTLLRQVHMQVELTPLKTKAIQELGYGTNAKVLVGFRSRPWEKRGYSGSTYSDEPFQLAWSNSFLQPGPAGGLTLYSGGKMGVEVGQGTPEAVAARLMEGMERVYPGVTREQNGTVRRFHWPSFEWTKGSYACYKPGQWTTIAGSEGLPVGNLFFAGEHCSYDFQGFMNGAAQSGVDTAKAVMAKVSGAPAALPKAARRYSRRELVHLA